MSIILNGNTIAGHTPPQSYRFVGEIFQSAIPINDTKVALLDGHTITSSEGYGQFIQYITSVSFIYPQLACTEEEWQNTVTTYGECGKFVIGDSYVRLPRIVNFVQGLSSLNDLANIVEAGLPNITGSFSGFYGESPSASGALTIKSGGMHKSGLTTVWDYYSLGLDASLFDPIYGNSDTVQPQAIQYPYYIVLATGVTQNIQAVEDIEYNIPHSLGESKYSPIALNNLSWLKSEGQWNPASTYSSFYEWLLKIYNGTETVEGVSVKLWTDESATDYDFRINTADMTFRLPLLDGSEDIISDKYDSLTLGESNDTYTAPANGWFNLAFRGTTTDCFVKLACNNMERSQHENSTNWGALTMLVKKGAVMAIEYRNMASRHFRFIYAQGNGSLYYYVGEAVQNAHLINVGRIEEKITEALTKPHIVETYQNGTSWYRIYSDGWCEQGGISLEITQSLTFLKTFATIPNLIATKYTSSTESSGSYAVRVLNLSPQGCTIRYDSYTADVNGYCGAWQAKGYIA